jgi:hypothetical protein
MENDYRPGDWEIDVVAALPAAAEHVRVCVDGLGVTTIGAGNGRVAVRGLPPDDTFVRIEVYDEDDAWLLATDWVEVGDETPQVSVSPVVDTGTPCTASGSSVAAGDEDRLLVARFVMED